MNYYGKEILETVPDGWKELEGTLTQPSGCKWYYNCEPLFVSMGNGAFCFNEKRKTKLVCVDKELFYSAHHIQNN